MATGEGDGGEVVGGADVKGRLEALGSLLRAGAGDGARVARVCMENKFWNHTHTNYMVCI